MQTRMQWRLTWMFILFNNESCLYLVYNVSQRLVWRPCGQCHEVVFTREFYCHTDPTPGIIMWDGMVSSGRTHLVFGPGTLAAWCCIDLVFKSLVWPFLQNVPGAVCQHDKAGKHVACATVSSLGGIDVLIWLASSLDLLPIEHMWDNTGWQLQKALPTVNLDDMRDQVHSEWQDIPLTIINNLIDGITRHISACISVHGDHPESR